MVDNNKIPSLIEQLGKAFAELESHNNIPKEKVLWKEIEDHFRHLDAVMEKKVSQIESMEKAFREEESYFTSLIAEREATVTLKEQDMLDQIQELKDAAVAEIIEACTHHEIPNLEHIDVPKGKASKVSSSQLWDKNLPCTPPKVEFGSPLKTGEKYPDMATGPAKPLPELTHLCEQMDAKGLVNFISLQNNQNNEPIIRDELTLALECAAEPGRLVLDSLEGFWVKKDENSLGGSILVLEAMAALLARAASELSGEFKQRARALADEWKPKLANAAPNVNYSLEAQAFLQLISTFSIASEFDKEQLCKLVLAASQHRQMPALCRSLGLTHQIPGIVEVLNKSGKQIYAVHFVHEFQLTETYPLASLLRTYLKDLRRNAQGKGNKFGKLIGVQNDANAQELAAVKAVIQCIEEYKLEGEYPLDPLQRRAAQLDRALKPDRKMFVETVKPQQFKKPRTNDGVFLGNHAAPGQLPAPTVNGERYPMSGAYNYQVVPAAQQGYDQRSYYYPPPPPPQPPQDERVNAIAYNSSQGGGYGMGAYNPHQPYL